MKLFPNFTSIPFQLWFFTCLGFDLFFFSHVKLEINTKILHQNKEYFVSHDTGGILVFNLDKMRCPPPYSKLYFVMFCLQPTDTEMSCLL